jgi:hypothetical protein
LGRRLKQAGKNPQSRVQHRLFHRLLGRPHQRADCLARQIVKRESGILHCLRVHLEPHCCGRRSDATAIVVLRGASASGRTERWQPALPHQSAGDGLAHSKHGRVIQASDGRLADRAKMWLATQQILGTRDALRIWIRLRRMSRLLRRFGRLRRNCLNIR